MIYDGYYRLGHGHSKYLATYTCKDKYTAYQNLVNGFPNIANDRRLTEFYVYGRSRTGYRENICGMHLP